MSQAYHLRDTSSRAPIKMAQQPAASVWILPAQLQSCMQAVLEESQAELLNHGCVALCLTCITGLLDAELVLASAKDGLCSMVHQQGPAMSSSILLTPWPRQQALACHACAGI